MATLGTAGLADLLAGTLLPKLRLADLQSLCQTSHAFKNMVLGAAPGAWQAAATNDGLPCTSFSVGDLYRKTAQLASSHAAIKAGPSGTASVRLRDWAAQFEAMALHPSFATAVQYDPDHYVLGVEALPTGTCAALVDVDQHRDISFRFLGGCCQAEQGGAPDGSHFVAIHAQQDKSGETLSSRLYSSTSGLHCELEVPFKAYSISWAPDSASFALLGEPDNAQCAVYEGRLSHSEPLNPSWLLPDCSDCTKCAWSPCSTYVAVSGETSLVLAWPQVQINLTRLTISDDYGLAWTVRQGQSELTVWESCMTEAGPHTSLLRLGHHEQTLGQALPIDSLCVGYGLAGCDAGDAVVIYGFRDGVLGPAVRTDCRMSVKLSAMAWAPAGGIWLAVVGVDKSVRGLRVATLVVLDGRSGRSVFRTEICRARGFMQVVCVCWSSSGQALVVGVNLNGSWVKTCVWFQDPAMRGSRAA